MTRRRVGLPARSEWFSAVGWGAAILLCSGAFAVAAVEVTIGLIRLV